MATLIKEHEGLIFEETFDENSLIWSLTPSNVDCLRFEPDGLHILHNSEYITYTMKEPGDEYCVVAQLNHKIKSENDIGGIIIMSDTNDYAECQSYKATAPSNIGNNGENISFGYDLSDHYVRYSFEDSTEDEEGSESSEEGEEGSIIDPSSGFVDKVYQFIKFVKYNNVIGPTYRFYASANGIDDWIEVGTVNFNKNCSIGFFLYAVREDDISLYEHNAEVNLASSLTEEDESEETPEEPTEPAGEESEEEPEEAEDPNLGKFVVNSFYMYEQKYITINGINQHQEFEIFDPQMNKTIMRSDTSPGDTLVGRYRNHVTIDTTGILMPLKNVWIRTYPRGHFDNTDAQFDLDGLTFGGDIFTVSYDIQLRIDNEIINSGEVYDLGYLHTNDFKTNVVVYNNDDANLSFIKVSIVAFSEYYSGVEVVKIALYDRNDEDSDYSNEVLENLEYKDSILIPILDSHTGVELIMKLSDIPKQEFYTVANKYRFKLLIE